MPAVSIIVPIYNGERFLARSLESVLAQTLEDFELILVNDGSADSSAEICAEYAGLDSRIKVIHKENGGIGSARNAGLEVSAGEYIGFCDQDDYLMPFMFEKLYERAREKNAAAVKCGMVPIDDASLKPPYPKTEDEINTKYIWQNYNDEFISAARYFELFLQDLADAMVWNILIEAKTCGKIRFWTRYCEDFRFQTDLMAQTGGYETLSVHGYLYALHHTSHMHRQRPREQSASDWLDYAYCLTLLYEQAKDELSQEAKKKALTKCASLFYRHIAALDKSDVENLRQSLHISGFLQKHTV